MGVRASDDEQQGRAQVIAVDAARGQASVELPLGTAALPFGLFFSGYPTRLPRVGDIVDVRYRATNGGLAVLVAHLVRPTSRLPEPI
jgi:hypothetical protein